MDDELSLAQKVTTDLERQVAQLHVQNQLASEELAQVKQECDAIADKLAKLELLNADLRDREAHSKKLAVEEFTSSGDFQEAVENTSSKYFCKGFYFCKRELHRHHSELGIELENMELDVVMLKEEEGEQEEERGEERRGEEGKERKTWENDGDQNGDPFTP